MKLKDLSKKLISSLKDMRKLFFGKKELQLQEVVPNIEPPPRRPVDTSVIRFRLKAQGWRLHEIPIRKNSPIPEERVISRWKLVAERNGKSVEAGGRTIDEAISNIGKALGVIAN